MQSCARRCCASRCSRPKNRRSKNEACRGGERGLGPLPPQQLPRRLHVCAVFNGTGRLLASGVSCPEMCAERKALSQLSAGASGCVCVHARAAAAQPSACHFHLGTFSAVVPSSRVWPATVCEDMMCARPGGGAAPRKRLAHQTWLWCDSADRRSRPHHRPRSQSQSRSRSRARAFSLSLAYGAHLIEHNACARVAWRQDARSRAQAAVVRCVPSNRSSRASFGRRRRVASRATPPRSCPPPITPQRRTHGERRRRAPHVLTMAKTVHSKTVLEDKRHVHFSLWGLGFGLRLLLPPSATWPGTATARRTRWPRNSPSPSQETLAVATGPGAL